MSIRASLEAAVVLSGLALLPSCPRQRETPPVELANPAHLEHLYEAFEAEGAQLGAVWIYCEAPDYHLVADPDEGFTCVDDVARALVFYCRYYPSHPSPEVLEKVRTLAEFLLYMQAENGFFYNFLFPDKQINTTHRNSRPEAAFWAWRAFWGLSELNLLEVEGLSNLQHRSHKALDTLVARMDTLCSTSGDKLIFDGIEAPACLAELGGDQAGLILAGLANYYRAEPSERLRALMLFFGNLLLETQYGGPDSAPYGAFLSWRNYWHAWGNSQAYALLYAGRILEYQPFIDAGLREVRYFYPYCLEQGFVNGFRLAREGDSLALADIQQFPQIAYGVRPMVFASLEAFAITGDTAYAQTAGRLAAWFFGSNPAGQAMYGPATGRAFDGIESPEKINRNSGAESTIEALLSLQALETVPAAVQVLNAIKRNHYGRD
ncbi:MAG: hypothetical protein KDC66_11595 [Phaeodactylibacter sp.]|nr:hypothetical protein [Phaeodactylibacter sp.]